MDESDASERLKQKVLADLEAWDDVTSFDIQDTDDPGILVEVEEPDMVRLYHVTLEQLPDGIEETHWSYIGESVS